MKKLTKVLLIIATVFVIIGVICLVGSVAMGVTWGTFTDMIDDGKFRFGGGELDIQTDEDSREFHENIHELDIEIDAGSLEIYYDDQVNAIQVKQENTSHLKTYVDEETLHMEYDHKWGIHNTDGKVIVILPQGMNFREVDLEIGAGQASINGLIADSLDVSVGAGQADIKRLDVKEMNAETGAGELHVEVLGEEEDYSYQLECGIGNITIAGQSYSGLGNEKKIRNENAKGELDIECGVGEVKIEFVK